jgi:hypothetical protein
MQLAAHIVGGAHLGADRVAERERFFAWGAEPPVACRIGHFELEIHCMPAVSANIRCSSMWGAGGEAVRSRSYGGSAMLQGGLRTCCLQQVPTPELVHRAMPFLPLVVRNSKNRTSRAVEHRGLGRRGLVGGAVTSAGGS